MRHKIGGLILLCSLLLGGASAQSPALPQTLSVRVLGPVLAQPAALAPAAGVRQQIVLVSLGGGGVAVLVYRFGESGQPLSPAGDALLANKMAENLATSSGYREVSPAEAQKLANQRGTRIPI